MIKITIEDYVQHLSGFHFQLFYDPTLLHGSDISFHNQIHQEFVLLYHWHALLPDFVKMKDKAYSFKDTLFNPKPFVDTGMTEMTNSLINQFAGTVISSKLVCNSLYRPNPFFKRKFRFEFLSTLTSRDVDRGLFYLSDFIWTF